MKLLPMVCCLFVVFSACSDNSLPAFAQGGPTCLELGVLNPSESETDPDDGCPILPIPVADWNEFAATYRPDLSDFTNTQPNNPIFQIHDKQNDDAICVDLQMFTQTGEDWEGQTGEFPLDCEGHGLCFSIYPDGQALQATAGSILIEEFPKVPSVDGQPYRVTISDVTFGETGESCYHVNEVVLEGTFSDLSGTL